MTTASGLKIKKLVDGTGPLVELGDLVGVRFKGNYGTYEFDNIFNTAEPYYMRAGVGTLVKVRVRVRAPCPALVGRHAVIGLQACLCVAFFHGRGDHARGPSFPLASSAFEVRECFGRGVCSNRLLCTVCR